MILRFTFTGPVQHDREPALGVEQGELRLEPGSVRLQRGHGRQRQNGLKVGPAVRDKLESHIYINM